MNEPKLAIVHERFTEIAGSEHVVEQLSLTWPHAAVHVPLARPAGIPAGLSSPPVTTWVDGPYRMMGRSSYAPLMPLLPSAFRGMKLGEVDAVVVSHHAFATQAAFATDAPVIAYVHSPARWAWDPAFRAQESGGAAGAAVLAALAQVARRGELKAVSRLDQVVANSTEVADRIQRWWGREAVVVHPPVDTHGFTLISRSTGKTSSFLPAAWCLTNGQTLQLEPHGRRARNSSLWAMADGWTSARSWQPTTPSLSGESPTINYWIFTGGPEPC